MTCDTYDSPAFIKSLRLLNASYSSSLSTSASTCSASVWSDTSSQHSDDTSISVPSDVDPHDPYFHPKPVLRPTNPSATGATTKSLHPAQPPVEVPRELRQNPRRTSASSTARSGCPPPLVRQCDRKVNFVDNLVDSSTQIVEAIWPTSSVACRSEASSNGVLPLRTFIQETLRRSRTSYSTLQVALYYLVLIKPYVPNHDFTMEQQNDGHAVRALQCGRRMFLAALILASKYLQDRNYSARAWSKISGLNTQEINQNEMAFVTAIGWKLHITDEIYNRWTDCVMKHTPTQPPSPGGCAQRIFDRQCEDFKNIILRLTPNLDNLDEVLPQSPCRPGPPHVLTLSPKSLFSPSQERLSAGPFGMSSGDPSPVATLQGTPAVMEPVPASAHTPGRMAPALGLLPTPRLTPQANGFGTPAASAACQLLGKAPSMSFAMAQASATQCAERWPVSVTASPQNCHSSLAMRRSSLANSVSTVSSPESMVSDSSRISRSSSISSASSLASAPSSKLDVLARCRYAKGWSEKTILRPAVSSVPEDYEDDGVAVSPESFGGVSHESCNTFTAVAALRHDHSIGETRRDAVSEAARALQKLHYQTPAAPPTSVPVKAGFKRGRTVSMDDPLQDNVREMLTGTCRAGENGWPESLVHPLQQLPAPTLLQEGRKRVCCSAEVFQPFNTSLHPTMGELGRPGMWQRILN
ncbi:hypothetical protein VTK73DRAFT_8963 [Phialemonium thermophilum]|uniref:G1/S-specific cyclin pas1 n=1 Tax=Phialemonium thermophilum TaxID=223376 RepID=A0ABR3Y531_9PEZI